MKHVLMIVAGMLAAGAVMAHDAGFCTSMCDSRQRECRATAQAAPPAERFWPPDTEHRNTLARTAQGAVPGQATRALDAQGANGRRMARLDACTSTFQRCSRSCTGTAPAQTSQASPRQASEQAGSPH